MFLHKKFTCNAEIKKQISIYRLAQFPSSYNRLAYENGTGDK
jgi:hypothetical protein